MSTVLSVLLMFSGFLGCGLGWYAFDHQWRLLGAALVTAGGIVACGVPLLSWWLSR